jgi:hypothetical protein
MRIVGVSPTQLHLTADRLLVCGPHGLRGIQQSIKNNDIKPFITDVVCDVHLLIPENTESLALQMR